MLVILTTATSSHNACIPACRFSHIAALCDSIEVQYLSVKKPSEASCKFKTTRGCVAADEAVVKQVPKQHQPAPRSDVESLINRWAELTDAAGLGYVAAKQTLLCLIWLW